MDIAFESTAPNVLIKNLTVEKYSSVAQKGAIHGTDAVGWTIENSEIRLNSGAGIGVGTGGRVRACDIHHNGQIGMAGEGHDIRIENNRIWDNNIYGFDFTWEAGGVKLGSSARRRTQRQSRVRQYRAGALVRHRLPQCSL